MSEHRHEVTRTFWVADDHGTRFLVDEETEYAIATDIDSFGTIELPVGRRYRTRTGLPLRQVSPDFDSCSAMAGLFRDRWLFVFSYLR